MSDWSLKVTVGRVRDWVGVAGVEKLVEAERA